MTQPVTILFIAAELACRLYLREKESEKSEFGGKRSYFEKIIMKIMRKIFYGPKPYVFHGIYRI